MRSTTSSVSCAAAPAADPFCRELTHISQADVDAAAPFREVWASFEHWLGQHREQLQAWVSWGDYDRQQLHQEWHLHGLDSLRTLAHINLKQRFAKARHLQRPAGLNGALQLAGMHFCGQQHRALEDARNTARLLPLSLPPTGPESR